MGLTTAGEAIALQFNRPRKPWPFMVQGAPIGTDAQPPQEENSLESPDAGLLSNLHTDEPDTSMAGDDDGRSE